jgi:uncharacterized membrane protein
VVFDVRAGLLAEGVMRAWGDRGLSQTLALAEVVLSVIFSRRWYVRG